MQLAVSAIIVVVPATIVPLLAAPRTISAQKVKGIWYRLGRASISPMDNKGMLALFQLFGILI